VNISICFQYTENAMHMNVLISSSTLFTFSSEKGLFWTCSYSKAGQIRFHHAQFSGTVQILWNIQQTLE